MGDLYSEIRERSKQDYGQKFEEWAPRILVDQYSDRTHFIFELIQNAEDALEFILAGATAVSVGTANFVNPTATLDVIDGIQAYMEKYGVKDIHELIGAVK